jgi:hypothetical protein
MEIEVELGTSSSSIELTSSSTLEVVTGVSALNRFSDIIDFDPSNTNDKYVLVYDASIQKYKMVNPDEVLNAAASTETIQPGLQGYADPFLNTLDNDLDDRIDLDAGSF